VHWLVAAVVVIVIPLGLAIPGMPRNSPSRDLTARPHRSVGMAILVAMLFRTGWRLRYPPAAAALERCAIGAVFSCPSRRGRGLLRRLSPRRGARTHAALSPLDIAAENLMRSARTAQDFGRSQFRVLPAICHSPCAFFDTTT